MCSQSNAHYLFCVEKGTFDQVQVRVTIKIYIQSGFANNFALYSTLAYYRINIFPNTSTSHELHFVSFDCTLPSFFEPLFTCLAYENIHFYIFLFICLIEHKVLVISICEFVVPKKLAVEINVTFNRVSLSLLSIFIISYFDELTLSEL
jgi:hypothetical protein